MIGRMRNLLGARETPKFTMIRALGLVREGLLASGQGLGRVDGAMSGSPVSPGIAEGLVRVVFEPQATHLLPGEILVCPGTDSAWTPLFLSAGGRITEVGGMMTHGSVVAREYGIPAVVGVHEATARLRTGQRIRLDGMTGTIEILEEAGSPHPPATETADGAPA